MIKTLSDFINENNKVYSLNEQKTKDIIKAALEEYAIVYKDIVDVKENVDEANMWLSFHDALRAAFKKKSVEVPTDFESARLHYESIVDRYKKYDAEGNKKLIKLESEFKTNPILSNYPNIESHKELAKNFGEAESMKEFYEKTYTIWKFNSFGPAVRISNFAKEYLDQFEILRLNSWKKEAMGKGKIFMQEFKMLQKEYTKMLRSIK
jgi:hypothetical protein